MGYLRIVQSLLTWILAATVVISMTVVPASAVTNVVVTTTDDVTNPADGVVSLREAIDIANSDADDTVIQIGTALTYQLTDCVAKEPQESLSGGTFFPPAEDNANLDGDLDHTAADNLTIEGNGSTIKNTCLYDRVLHNQHENSMLVLDDLTVTGGISPPGSGTNIWVFGSMIMTNVKVTDGVSDIGSQSAGIVVGFASPDNLGMLLTMTNSSILGNGAGGVRVDTGDANVTDSIINDNDGAGFTITFGTLTMDSTTLVDNNGNGVSGIDGAINVTNSAAGNNNGFGFRNTGNAESGQPLNLTNVNSIDNARGGVVCSYCTGLNLLNSTVFSNDGVGVAMRTNVIGPTMTITNTTITDNTESGTDSNSNEAGGVEMVAEGEPTPLVTITRSTIAGNTSAPGGDGGGILVINAGLEIDNSTITQNEARGEGGGIASIGTQPIDLNFVTLVENTATSGAANIQRETGALNLTATVLALPIGGANCTDTGGSETSEGFNQADDLTCGIGGALGDVAPAPNPMLGALGSHGGPTPTRIPLAGSPLLGAVIGVICDTAVEDQRGISRPQGVSCEVGAVEENEVLLSPPMFVGGTALMLVGRKEFLRPDAVLRDWLAGRNYDVVPIDDDDLSPAVLAQLADANLVVISSSVRLNKVIPFVDAISELEVPILTTEGYLSDDLGLATKSGETKKTTQVDIVDTASGLNGRVQVLMKKRRMAFGLVGSDANVVATAKVPSSPPVVFSYAAGDELADGSAAAGARGAFLFDYLGPLSARDEAFILLDFLHDSIMQ
ncbi:MAG: right-handed parallel beta-helix repeat-containing protein [Methylococcaceae bacterium]